MKIKLNEKDIESLVRKVLSEISTKEALEKIQREKEAKNKRLEQEKILKSQIPNDEKEKLKAIRQAKIEQNKKEKEEALRQQSQDRYYEKTRDSQYEIEKHKRINADPSKSEIVNARYQEVEKINAMTTDVEIQDYIRMMTMGYYFPLNPPEPIRSALRNKIKQLATDENHLSNFLPSIEGEWKKITIPPGAVY